MTLTTTEIREHCEFVRGLARALSRGRGDHEDLAQDAIERWLRALPLLPAEANHRGWLTTVLRNLFIDRFRRRARRGELPLDCERLAAPPGETSRWQEIGAAELDRELAKLPSDQRATLQLFVFEGKSYDEIASQQGIAKATVGTRILRARQRLRDLLESSLAAGA